METHKVLNKEVLQTVALRKDPKEIKEALEIQKLKEFVEIQRLKEEIIGKVLLENDKEKLHQLAEAFQMGWMKLNFSKTSVQGDR